MQFYTPPTCSISMAGLKVNFTQVDTKILICISRNAAKDANKGICQVGDGDIVQVIWCSNSKDMLYNLINCLAILKSISLVSL